LAIYQRPSGMYWLCLTVDGHQYWESCKTHNKAVAKKILAIRQGEILEGRFSLLKKQAPGLGVWSEKYLERISHCNTRRRYACSRVALISFFREETQLGHISSARIDEFIRTRREEKVKAATINRDLRFLAQILKQAERERYIARSPFDLGRFFQNEIKDRRKPHILSWDEEKRLLSVASPRLRLLVVLGSETGLRTGEMVALRWQDIDFTSDLLQVRQSKTQSGIRAAPISPLCRSELLKWRGLIGPEYSKWVFPSFENRRHQLLGAGRKAWATALRKAGLPFFPIYNLRHTFASRMTAAGVSPITIAQMLGHSSSQIVPRYAQVLDQNRIDAMQKLESLRQSAISGAPRLQAPAQAS
jgi:integrase